MRTPPLPILVGLLSGLLLGGSLRHFSIDRESADADSSTEPQADIADESTPSSEELPHLPRPSFEEVLQLRGIEDAALLARFLEEATMEEVLALMEAISQGDAQIRELQWMIEVRGLELDPQALIAWTKTGGRSSGINRHGLYRKWAGIDPKAALMASLEEPPVVKQGVISRMQGGDLNEGVAILKEVLPDSPELKEFEKLRWAERAKNNPRAVLTEVLALDEGSDRTRNLEAVVDTWAKQDPVAALAWLEDQDDFHGAKGMMESALGELAKMDPRLARSKIEALPESISKSKLEGTAIKELASLDREEALNWAKELQPGSKRDFLFASMADSWEDEPEELLRLVQELEIDIRGSHAASGIQFRPSMSAYHSTTRSLGLENRVNSAAIDLAKESPEKAFLALHSLYLIPTRNQRHSSYGGPSSTEEIAKLWVNEDPQGAAKWSIELAESSSADTIQSSIFEAWASESPEDTATFVSANELAKDEDLSLTIAKQWSTEDPEAAIEWISQLEENVRDKVLYSTLFDMAGTQPVEALKYVNEIQNERSQDTLLNTAVNAWSRTDAQGLMTWLMEQPPQERIERLIQPSVEEWVLNQPQAASEWVVQMNDGPQKDQAAAGIVNGLISFRNPSKDFVSAEEWARTISDPEIRQETLDEIAKALERGN